MRRSTATNFLFYLFTISLLWMPKGLSRAGKGGYELANGKLTILTAEGFGQWKDANSGERQSVTKIEIAEGIRNIPAYSFRDMLRLQSVRIIEERAFSYCRQLQSVKFSGFELKEIGRLAFAETALRLVFIPASVQKIGSVAFLDCKKLLSLSFAEDANLRCVGMAAFYGTGVRFVQIPSSLAVIDAGLFSHSRIRSVYIPESVVTIEKSAFSYTRLESVLIPKSVKLIGDEAFSNCSQLKKVEFTSLNAPEKFGKDVFDMCLSLTTIRIPKGGIGTLTGKNTNGL